MENPNAFVVKPKLSRWSKIRAYLARDFDVLDLSYQIYAPKKFVWGNFEKWNGSLKLSQEKLFCIVSAEGLDRYKKYLDEEKLEVVKSLCLPEMVLESLAQQIRVYADARKQIPESVKSIEQLVSANFAGL